MWNELLEDLRFVIGLFFAALSLILLGASLNGQTDGVTGINLNLLSAASMGSFAVFMIGLSLWARPSRAIRKVPVPIIKEHPSSRPLGRVEI
jgi:hypothetical protein